MQWIEIFPPSNEAYFHASHISSKYYGNFMHKSVTFKDQQKALYGNLIHVRKVLGASSFTLCAQYHNLSKNNGENFQNLDNVKW